MSGSGYIVFSVSNHHACFNERSSSCLLLVVLPLSGYKSARRGSKGGTANDWKGEGGGSGPLTAADFESDLAGCGGGEGGTALLSALVSGADEELLVNHHDSEDMVEGGEEDQEDSGEGLVGGALDGLLDDEDDEEDEDTLLKHLGNVRGDDDDDDDDHHHHGQRGRGREGGDNNNNGGGGHDQDDEEEGEYRWDVDGFESCPLGSTADQRTKDKFANLASQAVTIVVGLRVLVKRSTGQWSHAEVCAYEPWPPEGGTVTLQVDTCWLVERVGWLVGCSVVAFFLYV
jgi:hypothetical protein